MSATVLVADDSAVVRAVVRARLGEHGYRVLEAADGAAALAQAREHAPTLVLLDVEMPVLDGYGTLAAIQADPHLATIPVIFLTGRDSGDDVAHGLGLGAHDYLRKPFEDAELLARVHVAVRTRRLQDELRDRNRQLERLSVTDALTGLHNRRHLDEQLRVLVSRSERHGHQLSVVLADIDHFKLVNDTHGHDAGDAVLVEVGRRFAATLRTEDVVGRWGGEEFLFLLSDIDAAHARPLVERLRAGIAAAAVPTPAGPVAVTASFGAAAWAGGPPEALVAAADAALYASKDGGRDRVSWVA